MFLLNLPMNLKEQAAIERRRREEKERVSRIFNVKHRTIGIDRDSLDEQIKERQQRKQLEKQRNDAFDREMIRNDLQSFLLEEDESSEERAYTKELNEYRRLYQRPEHAKEWDLNDPNRWKELAPARIKDDDPRLGPSSGQVFVGEDLQASARRRAQQEQLKTYFNSQMMYKTERNDQERLANLLYDYKQIELSERSQKLEQMENECHRAMKMATQNYNRILADEVKARTDQRKARQTEEELAELANTASSDLLTENYQHLLDSRGHVLVDRWKGMTKDQLDDIRRQQLAQIDECQNKNATAKRFDQTWNHYLNAVAKQGTIIEQETKDQNRQFRQQLANENQDLAKIQREHQTYLNSTVYRSAPSAAFYQQFNTTSR